MIGKSKWTLLLLLIFSQFALAQYSVESLELTVYVDGHVKVSQTIRPDEYTVAIEIPLMGKNIKGLMVRDENNNPLPYKINGSNLSIYFENVALIKVVYYTPDFTSKKGAIWSINFTSDVPVVVNFPDNAVIVGLNNVPLKIEKNKLTLPQGNISVSYVIETEIPPVLEEQNNSAFTIENKDVQEKTSKYAFPIAFLMLILAGAGYLMWKKPQEGTGTLKTLPLTREEFQRKLEETELSSDEIKVLLYIYDRGGKAPQAEIKKMLKIPKTTAWRMFKRLEEQGFVRIYKKKRENWVELVF